MLVKCRTVFVYIVRMIYACWLNVRLSLSLFTQDIHMLIKCRTVFIYFYTGYSHVW